MQCVAAWGSFQQETARHSLKFSKNRWRKDCGLQLEVPALIYEFQINTVRKRACHAFPRHWKTHNNAPGASNCFSKARQFNHSSSIVKLERFGRPMEIDRNITGVTTAVDGAEMPHKGS